MVFLVAMRRLFLFLFVLFLTSQSLIAQEWKPVNGVIHPQDHYTLFKNATIYLGEGKYLSKSQLLIHKDKIVVVGKDVVEQENMLVRDLEGKFIYPSFIELQSHFGLPKTEKNSGKRTPQLESNKQGPFYWNEAVKAELNAKDLLKYEIKEAKRLRAMGFGAVLSHQGDGVVRGTSVLLGLHDEKGGEFYKANAGFHYSFFKGSSKQSYPNSLMGIIALIRQFKYDAQWYEAQINSTQIDFNASLQALVDAKNYPQFIDADSYLSVLRAQSIGTEFGQALIIKGTGQEYKITSAINIDSIALIVPVNYPKAYEVDDPFENLNLSLGRLKDYEMAPYNLSILNQNGVSFCITADQLKDFKSFHDNISQAISKGLSRSVAIDALTKVPADLIGVSDRLGQLRANYIANFIITEDSLFSASNILYENWVSGQAHYQKEIQEFDLEGDYNLVLGKREQYTLKIRAKSNTWTAEVKPKGEEKPYKTRFIQEDTRLKLSFDLEDRRVHLIGSPNNKEAGILSGRYLKDGEWLDWAAIKKPYTSAKDSISESDKEKKREENKAKVFFPNMAYGWDSLPSESEIIIFRNATLWTNEEQGILRNHDLLIAGGKIKMLGYKIDLAIHFPELVNKVKEVDATGLHITAGIIDEHSHIAIQRGVNESGQAVTAEVRIGDVVRPDDINIYRQLSGGVTTSQLLHGSANPIGGQSALIKLKWGKTAEEMKIDAAPKFIKFALGENVKQSNWGDNQTIRFPQTRMGVEQVFYDAFYRARSYKDEWELWNAKSKRDQKKSTPPRRDLELETLAQILDTQRFVTCHSYIQSEINMLMHVADSMRFKMNTFTHILEGYKVADKMAEHGVAGSTFSDWWAYKYEVNDAIPYNGAVMHNNGVLVGFNSDDAEMGRRLNQEAAKAMKYGNVSQEEAWKFVTLNPAKMLHLDDRIGSLKEGKDADIVVWTDNPLSIKAMVRQTYIEGINYFDWDRNEAMKKRDALERERLIQKMALAKKKGESVQKVKHDNQILYECNTLEQ